MRYTCSVCGKIYDYCRACVLTPIPHKESGLCSIECYRVSKNQVVPSVEPEPIVEEVLTEDTEPIEEEVSIEVEANIIAPIETTTVVESTIKNETNTYKNKKHKYKYTSSY